MSSRTYTQAKTNIYTFLIKMMKMWPMWGWLILFLNLSPLQTKIVVAQAHPPQPRIATNRQGCNITRCGDVEIPYPFGIGPNCSYNHFFDVTCKNNSVPILTELDVEVVDLVSGLYQSFIEVKYQSVRVCGSTTLPLYNLTQVLNISSDSPFSLLPSNLQSNYLIVQGCNTGASIMTANGTTLYDCTPMCNENQGESSFCLIPIRYLDDSTTSYQIGVTIGNNTTSRHGGSTTCASVSLVDEYTADSSSGAPSSYILLWTGEHLNKSKHSNCTMNTSFKTVSCQCETGYRGNPYVPDSCQVAEECKECKGKCVVDASLYDYAWDDDPNQIQYHRCEAKPSARRELEIALPASIGSMALLLVGFSLYQITMRMKEKRRRAKNFKKNGGLLLQQMTSVKHCVVDKTLIFSITELEKATDDFSKKRVIGDGGQGTVYKGMLGDGRTVAIKKANKVDGIHSQEFINEVVILSQINHRNVVKLLGCCLEADVPLLVYEYVPNGMLSTHIHEPHEDFHITWPMRLEIAIEIAGALAYLHSSSSNPIYHRDIKSSNILLDDKYRAKVADFGISRTMNIDQTHLTTKVVGTFGYFDPEYFRSHRFTDKSDVYSFGVVLLELLTGKRAVLATESNGQKSLVLRFMEQMETSNLLDILDPLIVEESIEELVAVANLATRCLNMVGDHRPSMKEVVLKLEGVRSQQPGSLVTFCHDVEKCSTKTHNYKSLLPLPSFSSSFFTNVYTSSTCRTFNYCD